MAKNKKLTCLDHPNYTGLRLGKNAKRCPTCVKIYEERKKTGKKEIRDGEVKEKKKPKKKNKIKKIKAGHYVKPKKKKEKKWVKEDIDYRVVLIKDEKEVGLCRLKNLKMAKYILGKEEGYIEANGEKLDG